MQINREIADAFVDEVGLHSDLDSAVAVKCELENKLQDPKETQTPFMRMNIIKQSRLNSDYEKHMAIVMRHRQKVFDLRTQLLELQNKIDALAYQQLQETNAPELSEHQEITEFYSLSYKKITSFQSCLRHLLTKLGSARTAMSASDQTDQKTHSASTQEIMQEARLAGKELDEAIRDMNALSREFEDKAFDPRVALTLLPRFNERGYENLTMEAFWLPIAQAHTELESILNDCEELDTKETSAAYIIIEDAQQSHKEQTDALVRDIWQQAQRKHLSGCGKEPPSSG